MKKPITFLNILMAGFLFIASGYAEEEALSIIREVDRKQKSSTEKMEMSMFVYPDARDALKHRDFRLVPYGKGDDLTYMELLQPRNIKGLKIGVCAMPGARWHFNHFLSSFFKRNFQAILN